jgi:hydroxymethylpyrimidine/phosphomethylpyrimidine kinase
MTNSTVQPLVLSFSGHDPSGGAGIQADIESSNSMGVPIATVITALTVQDTQTVSKVIPVDAALIKEQAKAILEDMPVSAFKLGILGSIENIEAVHDILHQYSDIPVVTDPIIRSGTGTSVANKEMIMAFSDLIFPLTKLVTPNSNEALWLASGADNLDSCAQELMDDGCEYVLITGTHETTDDVINSLYHQHKKVEDFHWQRLPHEYHGSGCTLASSIAALLARGLSVFDAVNEAQNFTWEALSAGKQLGMGQFHPNRFFWTQDEL